MWNQKFTNDWGRSNKNNWTNEIWLCASIELCEIFFARQTSIKCFVWLYNMDENVENVLLLTTDLLLKKNWNDEKMYG